jgi:hypothetical protein
LLLLGFLISQLLLLGLLVGPLLLLLHLQSCLHAACELL